MGGIGSFINTVLAPVGIKPFKGGPYADDSLGDAALKASAPLQTAGTNFLNLSQGKTSGPTDPYADLFSQLAYQSGVNSPFATSTTDVSSNPTGAYVGPAGTPAAPGTLSGAYLDQFNNYKSHMMKALNDHLGAHTADYSKRGLSGSTADDAQQAYIKSLYNNHLNDLEAQLGGAQHNERLQTLNDFIQKMQGFGNQGAGMVLGNVQNLNTNANAATQRTNNANSQLGGFASLFTPGGLFGGGLGSKPSSASGGNSGGSMYGPPESMANYNSPATNPYLANEWWNPVSANN